MEDIEIKTEGAGGPEECWMYVRTDGIAVVSEQVSKNHVSQEVIVDSTHVLIPTDRIDDVIQWLQEAKFHLSES
jgi:hypothetical protein|tara:strand:- start:217 stop:438 length:222 start_codon:yes stop_codon:yes gene_type:complete